MHTVKECSTLEHPPRIFLLQSEQLSCSLPKLGQQKMHSPDLPLVLESILANQLELMVDSLLLKGSPRGLESARVYI